MAETPWVAIPNRTCPECGLVAELQADMLFRPANLDDQHRVMWVTFICPNKHGIVMLFKDAVSASGKID